MKPAKGLRARFDRNYEVILRRAQAGQALDGKIDTGIGHDGQKSEIQLAEEFASQRQARLLATQGVPTTGAAARAQLLAKFGKKNTEQRT